MNSNVTSTVNQSILPCEEPLDLSCRSNRMTENVRMNPDSLRPLIHPASDQYSPLPDWRVTITNPKISSTVATGMSNAPTFQALSVSGSRDLNNQEKTDKKVEVYSCEVCGKGFGGKNNLAQHRIMHLEKKPYSCEICGRGFLRKNGFRQHKKMHAGDRAYPCSICSKMFITISSLNQHVRNGHIRKKHTEKAKRSDKKDKPCEICGKVFVRKFNLKVHIATHTKERPHLCSICNKGFALKFTLKMHMRIHSGEKPYSCDICGKPFRQISNLRVHMLNHTAKKHKSYAKGRPESSEASELLDGSKISSAATAGTSNDPTVQALLSVSDLKSPNNQETTDKKVKSHVCELCNKTFTKRSYLQRHMKIHSGKKSYLCEVCDKKFIMKYNVKVHMRLHTGEKPYLCNVCDKQFAQNCSLKRHMFLDHAGQS